VDCEVPLILQVAASAPTCSPTPSTITFDEADHAERSLDDPPLEACKRELDAVLASLDR